MAEEYQVTLEENKDLYLNVFHEEHKNYKIYRRRERGVFLTALIYFLLGCLFNWIDAMRTGAWDREYFVGVLLLLLGGGYIAARFTSFVIISSAYDEYWVLREYLYSENIYTEKIIFSCDGIQILGYDRDRNIKDFILYQNVKQMSFYKTGIILWPNDDEHIYIPRTLFKNRRDLVQIKKWYGEKNGYGKTSI